MRLRDIARRLRRLPQELIDAILILALDSFDVRLGLFWSRNIRVFAQGSSRILSNKEEPLECVARGFLKPLLRAARAESEQAYKDILATTLSTTTKTIIKNSVVEVQTELATHSDAQRSLPPATHPMFLLPLMPITWQPSTYFESVFRTQKCHSTPPQALHCLPALLNFLERSRAALRPKFLPPLTPMSWRSPQDHERASRLQQSNAPLPLLLHRICGLASHLQHVHLTITVPTAWRFRLDSNSSATFLDVADYLPSIKLKSLRVTFVEYTGRRPIDLAPPRPAIPKRLTGQAVKLETVKRMVRSLMLSTAVEKIFMFKKRHYHGNGHILESEELDPVIASGETVWKRLSAWWSRTRDVLSSSRDEC